MSCIDLEVVMAACSAGLAVVPPAEDGSKRPLGHWKRYQTAPPAPRQLAGWYGTGRCRTGLGVICGQVSGHLEMFELEGRAVDEGLYDEFVARLEAAGLGEVWRRVAAGYRERTPTGGLHLLWRCVDGIEGNLRLARRPATDDEVAVNPDDKIMVLIETRGEGGYTICAPSNGTVHPSGGEWMLEAGGFGSIATITGDERAALLDVARSLDRMPVRELRPPSPRKTSADDEDRPGDWYTANHIWDDVLSPHGWQWVYDQGDESFWRRPGKTWGTSATTNYNGSDLLKVFSTSTPFDVDTAYDRFAAYTILEHDSDFSAAARTVRALMPRSEPAKPGRGYRDDPPPPTDDDYDHATDRREFNGQQPVGGEVEPIAPLTVVTAEAFAGVDEPGAAALLGEPGAVLIPEGGDVMVYGDGGAGKTTLMVDLSVHLAAGQDWLGITVARPLRVLLIENEGPRPLFRAKVRQRLHAWDDGCLDGGCLDDHLSVVETPWAHLTFAHENHRRVLADTIVSYDVDVVIIGPLTRVGMDDAGTLSEVRSFMALVDDVRRQAARPVTFVLVHHENKGGKVSGAWEGAGDTLLHVQGQGQGHTRLFIQKARWSTVHHSQTLQLAWTDGGGFRVNTEPEKSDDDIADDILSYVAEHPGTGWKKVEDATTGIRAKRKRSIRDGLLADRRLVNVIKVDGIETALDHCPERTPAHLYVADDPAIGHLQSGLFDG